jgi:hypothetical protein
MAVLGAPLPDRGGRRVPGEQQHADERNDHNQEFGDGRGRARPTTQPDDRHEGPEQERLRDYQPGRARTEEVVLMLDLGRDQVELGNE